MAVERYRQPIQQLLSERANSQSQWPEYEVQTLFDTERDHMHLSTIPTNSPPTQNSKLAHLPKAFLKLHSLTEPREIP